MLTRVVALKSRTLLSVVVLAGLAGGLVGYLLPSSRATSRILTGAVVAVNDSGDAIGFRPASEGPGRGGRGYAIETTQWMDRDGQWHGEKPIDCVTPLSSRHRPAGFGIVDVDRHEVVVWIHCLD